MVATKTESRNGGPTKYIRKGHSPYPFKSMPTGGSVTAGERWCASRSTTARSQYRSLRRLHLAACGCRPHGCTGVAASMPTTVVQGRTVHDVTSPDVT